jgi:hypothetical protein
MTKEPRAGKPARRLGEGEGEASIEIRCKELPIRLLPGREVPSGLLGREAE